jgi:hypothetical protein
LRLSLRSGGGTYSRSSLSRYFYSYK